MLENFDIETEVAEMYVNCYKAYTERGENCIAGWDYCRALNLMSYYYVAGYYTEEEALDKSLEIAETAQPLFTSWDDLIDSYMYGYEYWAEESSDERREIYEDLKKRDDNPYSVDYNTELVKGMMRPVLKFAQMPVWSYDFAPHDVGTYPVCCGQVYGLNRNASHYHATYAKNDFL